jgi:transcriptional regulator with XRE-family HTH domain
MHDSDLINDATVDAAQRELGRCLAGLRESANYSQAELARKIGYSRTAVGDAEHGRRTISGSFWAATDSALNAKGELIDKYERISVRRKRIVATRAATRAIERAAAREARTAARSTVAAVLSAATGAKPVPAIAAIVIVWADGTTTTATPPSRRRKPVPAGSPAVPFRQPANALQVRTGSPAIRPRPSPAPLARPNRPPHPRQPPTR